MRRGLQVRSRQRASRSGRGRVEPGERSKSMSVNSKMPIWMSSETSLERTVPSWAVVRVDGTRTFAFEVLPGEGDAWPGVHGQRVNETLVVETKEHERAGPSCIGVCVPLGVEQDGVVSRRCDELESVLGCRHGASQGERRAG